MNVGLSTQLELLLLNRTLEIIRSTPGLSIASFYDEFIDVIRRSPQGSLSAYWKLKYNDSSFVSLVGVNADESESGKDDIDRLADVTANIPELQYLKDIDRHIEARHDPLLVIRNLYDTAVSSLLNSSDEEKSVLLKSALLMSLKSARLSLLLHVITLLYLFKDEMKGIESSAVIELYNRAVELVKQRKLEEGGEYEKLSSEKLTTITINQGETKIDLNELTPLQFQEKIRNDANNSLVLSFGKADHGKVFFDLK